MCLTKVKLLTFRSTRPYDCPIDLQPGKDPPRGPIYNLSPSEIKALREYIEEHLANGSIQHSKSPARAPFFCQNERWLSTIGRGLPQSEQDHSPKQICFTLDLEFTGVPLWSKSFYKIGSPRCL